MKNCCSMLLGLALLLAPSGGYAQESECLRSQELDRYHLLRRLSLDLRHRLPDYEEYLALDGESTVPDSLIEAWMAGDEFRIAMRRFHEHLLWPNVRNVRLADPVFILTKPRGDADGIFSIRSAARRSVYRGDGQLTCLDQEQTDFDETGHPIPIVEEGNTRREGWVRVRPYWAPETTIRVCAYDAQTTPTAPSRNGEVTSCSEFGAQRNPRCGCGPDLRWCYGPDVARTITEMMREQLLRLIDAHTVGGKPYSGILTDTTVEMNGTLDFWKKHLAHLVSPFRIYNAWQRGDPELPEDPDFLDTTWRPAEVDPEMGHAGILTLPAYTLRFQTNRSRANRFRIVFTGQYFVPPADPTDTDCDPVADDLTQRCTCRYCHQVLEPLAAAFGKIAEAGSALISDREVFPIYEPACDPLVSTIVPRICERFYVTDPAAYNPGTLLPYQYADVGDAIHQQIADNLEGGPISLARRTIASGQFAAAIVKHLFHTFMGREMILDPSRPENEIDLLRQLTEEFQAHDDFKTLVKRLVHLPQYRRIR